MRIIAGAHRGRRLEAPGDRAIRPTADRVRENVFNILVHGLGVDLIDAVVLDVFAGTGAFGLEALSRGAARIVFIDQDEAVLRLARRNAAALGEAAKALPLRLDATAVSRPPRILDAPARLAFLDPPYGSGLAGPALATLARQGWLAAGAIAVVETGSREEFTPPPGFALLDDRRYGAARVRFLAWRGRTERAPEP